jgi:hypothetical protein
MQVDGQWVTTPSVQIGGGYNMQPPPQVNAPQLAQPASDPVDIAQTGKTLYKGLTSNNPTVLPTGVANAVDNFGQSVLGVGNVVPLQGPPTPGFVGPAPAGTGVEGGLSTNFSPANIAGGVAGGLAANAVFGGGTGTNVGSAIGGIAGSFIPIPFVGTALGSFIGGGIGSMFGNKKPSSKRHTASFDFSNANILDTGYMEGKFSDRNDKLSKGYANLLGSITSGLGVFGEKEQGVGITADNLRGLGFSYGSNAPDREVKDFDQRVKNFKSEGEFLNGFFDDFTERFGERLSQDQRNALATTDFTSGNTPEKLAELAGKLNIDPNKVLGAYQNIHGSSAATQQQQMGTPTPMVAGRQNTNWDDFMQRKLELEAQRKAKSMPNATGAAAKNQQVQPKIAPQSSTGALGGRTGGQVNTQPTSGLGKTIFQGLANMTPEQKEQLKPMM